MAGRGPAPKGGAIRRNRAADLRVVEASVAVQPELPVRRVWDRKAEKFVDHPWCDATRVWWASWGSHALSAEFTVSDWQFLLDTAVLHDELWSGVRNPSDVAAELRLRVAKFGATLEDRSRLRIQFATQVSAEVKAGRDAASVQRGVSARERFSGLASVG